MRNDTNDTTAASGILPDPTENRMLSVRVPRGLISRLRIAATIEGVSVANLVARGALAELDRLDKRRGGKPVTIGLSRSERDEIDRLAAAANELRSDRG